MKNQNVRNLQLLDIKYMAEKEASLKAYCRQTIKEYRQWQAQVQNQEGANTRYDVLEGRMLRHNLENAVAAYWFIRRDFRQSFQDYLTMIAPQPAVNCNRSVRLAA